MSQRTRKVARKRPSHTAAPASGKTASPAPTADWHERYDATEFADNMAAATSLWQQVVARLTSTMMEDPIAPIGHSDPFHVGESFLQAAGKMMSNPGAMAQQHMGLMRDHLTLWHQTTQKLLGNALSGETEVQDRRFKATEWNDNAFFDYLRRSYLINSQWTQSMLSHVEGLDAHTAQKVKFFMRQVMDALAPSNFPMTNPEVLHTLLQSNGASLVKGLQHMLRDIEDGKGRLRIRMTNEEAFELGRNLASTKGSVVYENDLMQLIQYAPLTPQVHQVPLLFIPAWINKYYVLDLREENSLVRWAVSQGYTVFMISWVNPDAELARKSFDDYLSEGPLAALDVIEAITGTDRTNLVGYCLGGTLVATTLAWLRAREQDHRVGSATYLTTMVDFTDAGELSVFIDEGQLASLEQRMSARGYLDGSDMATTFNMLRANDLIWSFVVNNYLMGKEPFAFDLLYWNSDSTRMPATMHSFYLRAMYQQNRLIKPGGIELLDTPINITKIATPTYILSTREDHIAPWTSTYAATQVYDGPVRFVLSQSGHVAGVVNPPAKNKYGYWTNDTLPPKPQQWLESSEFLQESWWLNWHAWQRAYAGKKVKARNPGSARYKPIEDAPGAYARIRG